MIVDKLLMALSTDWFFGYWHMIGLDVPDLAMRNIINDCRVQIRAQFNDVDVYWDACFSEDRVLHCENDLVRSFVRAGLPDNEIDKLRHILQEEQSFAEDSWLYASLTQLLVANIADFEDLTKSTKGSNVLKIWEQIQGDSLDYCSIAKPISSWDKYIVSLTPDLPTFVPDFLSLHFKVAGSFDFFWGRVKRELSSVELNDLLFWYKYKARELIGEDVAIPAWMH